ncbi:MAG: fibro-slime domain-containing protein [Planctomycetota bacterium]|nr:fibro-slime domain-containing protein [Planctomycetota bacterium]
MNRKSALNRILTAGGLVAAAGLVALTFPLQAGAQTSIGSEGIGESLPEASDPYAQLPATITLTGIVRDFRERSVDNGHPDFERRPDGGFGHYMGNVAAELGPDEKPVFTGAGKKVFSQWKNAQGRPIHPSLYDASLGDIAGSYGSSDKGGIQSGDSFRQWFKDIPGVNSSMALPITLRRQPGSNLYTFDDRQDPEYSNKGGFFPVNGKLFGNSSGDNKNFHFTYELSTVFQYEEGSGQSFTFNGDDDVWVFIDGQMVIDIGGVHSRVEQTVDLDRLDWLEDGRKYTLHFFFAERHRTQSNFRIETTLNLRNAELPTTGAMFD